jgi:hypothetical protein
MWVAAKELAVPSAARESQVPVQTTLISVEREGPNRITKEDAEHTQSKMVMGNVREPEGV